MWQIENNIWVLSWYSKKIEKKLLAVCIGGSISVPEESVIEKGKKFRPKTLSEIMVENQIEKTRKLILKAERAQMKIQQRKKEWEEL